MDMHRIFADATNSFEMSFRHALDQSEIDDDTFSAALSLMFQALDALNSIGASCEE